MSNKCLNKETTSEITYGADSSFYRWMVVGRKKIEGLEAWTFLIVNLSSCKSLSWYITNIIND